MKESAFPWQSLELHEFTASDNTTLFYHFRPAGVQRDGALVVTLAWNMSPDVCSPLLLSNALLADRYDVYIFIVRGYLRDSGSGNCVDRCAVDLHEFIAHFNIGRFMAMGHSIGVAIWWQYMMTYGQSRIEKFILLDEMTVLLQNPANSPDRNEELGSIVPLHLLFEAYNTMIRGDAGAMEYRRKSILPQFSALFQKAFPDILKKIFGKVDQYSLRSTAQILYSNQTNNWIDKLLNDRIDIPTFLFCGSESVVPYQSVLYQRLFYTDYRLHQFTGPTSSHFAWMENYTEFNDLINAFIVETPA